MELPVRDRKKNSRPVYNMESSKERTSRNTNAAPGSWSRLALFYAIACLFSWGCWLPGVLASHHLVHSTLNKPWLPLLATFGPALSALLVSWSGKAGMGKRALLQQLTIRKVAWPWYLVSLLTPAALMLAGTGLAVLLGEPPPHFSWPRHWYSIPATFLLILVLGGPLGEEPGWRGYAFPLLISRLGPLLASLVVGLLWAFWHLPLWFITGSLQSFQPFGGFLLQTLAVSVLFTWVWMASRGSLLTALLLHTAMNTSAAFLPAIPGLNTSLPAWWCTILAAVILVIVIIAAHPKRWLSQRTIP
jgi:membrane protease YdiL (CAAX protease family)